jgi:uncharacterized protein (TIGR02996 family)
MTNHEEHLLQAVLANPEDEHLRLVYADFLEEQGDVRSECIRLWHELSKEADNGRFLALRQKELQLRNRIDADWRKLMGFEDASLFRLDEGLWLEDRQLMLRWNSAAEELCQKADDVSQYPGLTAGFWRGHGFLHGLVGEVTYTSTAPNVFFLSEVTAMGSARRPGKPEAVFQELKRRFGPPRVSRGKYYPKHLWFVADVAIEHITSGRNSQQTIRLLPDRNIFWKQWEYQYRLQR